ncbi:MAG: O-antigen ligase family protein [bacterium]|nr:O-antigen ligase family protein [bacterium]
MATLLGAAAFFAPWGEGLSATVGFDASRVFIGLMVIVTASLPFIVRISHLPFNRALRIWIFYLAIHTLVVYGIWKPHLLEWGIIGQRELADGVSKIQEGLGLRILRFFLFVTFGAALAISARTSRARNAVLLSYAIGLSCVVALGGYQLSADPTTVARLAGGSLDPNAFGLACAIGVVACIHLTMSDTTSTTIRRLALILSTAPAVGLLASGSRGAILGTLAGIGGLTLLNRQKRRRALFTISLIAIATALALTLRPSDLRLAIQERLSIASVVEDRGSSRPELWRSYLDRFPAYAIGGTGMHSGPSAISESWDQPRMTHNVYLQILVEHGVLGLVLFAAGLFSAIRNLVRSGVSDRRATAALLLTWLVASFFVDSLNSRESWLVIGLACSNYDK